MEVQAYADEQLEKSSSSRLISKVSDADPVSTLKQCQLPPQTSFFRRVWKGAALMHYHRLFVLVMMVNMGIGIYGAIELGWFKAETLAIDTFSSLVLANFFVAIVIRQHYVINLLFAIATSIPKHWPLALRRIAAKVYHFGGFHSGCATAGTLWFALWLGALVFGRNQQTLQVSDTIYALAVTLMSLLCALVVMALPAIRSRFHNYFEATHRLGGWTSLILFWAITLVDLAEQSPTTPLVSKMLASTDFWLLNIITISVILPWLRLRKVPVEYTRPSSHAVLAKFDYGVTPFAGSSTALSRSPLLEWHSFANVPAPGVDGFRLTISRAGDWTGSLIDDLPSHLWVKGIPTAGVGNVDKLFKRVVWVATGSGIGPCLPHLLSQDTPSKLVWATRNPRKTYGDELVDEILSVQPHALIWDTDALGKPDMVKLAYQAWKEFDAEAVICISNQKLTWQVVYGMESRDIPAYGAIWDS
ncbi:hypothetical protein [Pleionea sp. CnH1-48]|uniref:hypothetical protein n=1 Tax=Pleionea sp. CnH1-48 TaxID=2954494 RepID=UPI0020980CB8|nr:hypothetical protein [Pleionea sp. CnH1-48]MCO7227491.1 hypothetical protein [Pleionea sp. CnH1-48]